MPPVITANRCDLYVTPGITRFGKADVGAFERYLHDLDAATSVLAVAEVPELQLDNQARTRVGGYRFTGSAFAQIAQVLANGLSKFLPDLSGAARRMDQRDELVDGRRAIALWNEMVDLRFSWLQQYRVIRNETSRTIEGLVGQRAHFLENVGLYQSIVSSLQRNQPGIAMYAAKLVGRRMAVWFRHSKPFMQTTLDGDSWQLRAGYYFCNGEATGVAIRGTLAIFTRHGTCLGPYRRYGGKVAHKGKDFFQKLGVMLDDITSRDLPVELIRQSLDGLLTHNLGFDLSYDQAKRKDRFRKLLHSLCHLGVPQNLASEVIQRSLDVGRAEGDTEARPTYQIDRLYAGRTLLDLFITLMRYAVKLDFSRREKTEQAAFEVLTGRFPT